MSEMTLENGKYTLIRHEDGRMEALRYGEKWRDLTGDKLIAALVGAIDAHLTRAQVQVTDEDVDVADRIYWGDPDAKPTRHPRTHEQGLRAVLEHESAALESARLAQPVVADSVESALARISLIEQDTTSSVADKVQLMARIAREAKALLSQRQPVAANVPDEMVFFTNGGVTNVNDYIRGDRVLTCHKEFAWGWNACREAMLSQSHPQAAQAAQGGEAQAEAVACRYRFVGDDGYMGAWVTADLREEDRLNDCDKFEVQKLYTHYEGFKPISMILHCPSCGMQHIDAPEEGDGTRGPPNGVWDNPPHRSHLCHGCGTIWRPSDVPTTGVASIQTKGKADKIVHSERAAVPEGWVLVDRHDLLKLLEANLSAANEAIPLTSGIDFIEDHGGEESDDDMERVAYHLYYGLFAAERLRNSLSAAPTLAGKEKG